MPAPDTTLQAIQNKVRRLTRSPSTAQITDTDLQNYINTFVVYDFPEHLRTFNLRTTFTFFTNPYQDEYPTDKASYGDPLANPSIVNNILYDFQNKYLTVHPPFYAAGYQTMFTQDETQFFGFFPKVNSIQFTGSSGDGITTTFTGTITTTQPSIPLPSTFQQQIGLLQRQVLFDALDSNMNGLALIDVPVIDAATGNPTTTGNLYDPNSAAYQAALTTPPTYPSGVLANNTINYASGAYTITFSTAPGANQPINSQTVPMGLARPRAVLYYGNKFVIRPIPDQVYRITFEVFKSPAYLMSTADQPALNEYWQFIALGSAIKIFQDRMDMDSVNLLMPEFKAQLSLCNRRTIVQLTNERAATIYTESNGSNGGFGGWGGFGGGTNF